MCMITPHSFDDVDPRTWTMGLYRGSYLCKINYMIPNV